MTNVLEVVRAGAGSGKTTDLCDTVAKAVASGLDPARILATTFTKRAAAELKGRVQAKLLEDSGHAHADRLELAAIGTVHSVAHRLLRRYAVELGLSPRLEVFEQGTESGLSDLLVTIPAARWDALSQHADRLGVTNLPGQILSLLSAKRGNRIENEVFGSQLAAGADRVCELLAPNGPAAEALPVTHLHALAEVALAQIEALVNDTTNDTTKAKRTLRRITSSHGALWASYIDAMAIKAGKKSGAHGLLDPLRLHAGDVRRNPQLHENLKEFAQLLAEETLALEVEYDAYKAERGLVDFTDLETLLLTLLEDESLKSRLSMDYDLVLVDEFQDTNPLQLAIFQCLRTIAPRNRWVGDARQAIYGFRDTDPRLVSEVWDRVPEKFRTTLPNNHRSQKGLVELVGELFAPHFDEDPRQQPQKPAATRGIERWLFGSTNSQNDALSLGCGLAQLHNEGIRFGDIAVLERGNAQLKALATGLDELGIPYLIESPGLFSTREGELLLAGLRLVANRNDSLAAATVLHLSTDPNETTPKWLSDRLQSLSDSQIDPETGKPIFRMPWQEHELLLPLEAIDFRSLAPSLVLQQVIEALSLPKRVHAWGDSIRRCSNLDSATRHARDYEEVAILGSGSATLSGLILYFEQLDADENDLRFTSQGHDAVTLLTYHAAKGLEWPVVVLSGLNSDRDSNMWKPVVRSPSFEEDPLLNREIRHWIWPFGMSDGPFPKIKSGSGLELDALASPEGQEQTVREREENLRLLYVGFTRAKSKLVLAHRNGSCQWLNTLTNADNLLDPGLDPGEHPVSGIDTTLVIRHLSHDDVDQHRFQQSTEQTWFAAPAATNANVSPARYHSPSMAAAVDGIVLISTSLPGDQFFPTKADEATYARIGNAVHSYMASLPSLRVANDELKTKVVERCLSAFGITGLVPASVIVSAGQRFVAWVDANYPQATWHTEKPVSGPRSQGGQWTGTIDLLLKLPTGEVVVIDHKSAPIRRNACTGKAAAYAGQLAAYEEILRDGGETVSGKWIHFPLAGVVVQLDV
ncbi:UvrD-helicase domain-containing protein [Lacunimicrobium album]